MRMSFLLWCLLLLSASVFLGCPVDDGPAGGFVCNSSDECNDNKSCKEGKCVLDDADKDGWAKRLDCNDSNRSIYPGAPEICKNGIDDNCDGNTDEDPCNCKDGQEKKCGVDTGACQQGVQRCVNGRWSKCTGEIAATKEDCNGKDDDCNGKIDDNLSAECFSGPDGSGGKGICKKGSRSCTDGKWSKCTGEVLPGKETCNGQDDDCNGKVDDGLSRECYDGPPGSAGKGICKKGTQLCEKGKWTSCQLQVKPILEDCNNRDDDCDGKVDDGLDGKCYNGPANSRGVGACKEGIRRCDAGKWTTCIGEVLPAGKETCNDNVDNDCNGQIDDGCTANLFEIRTSINTDTGKIDGILSPGWKGNGRFELKDLKIPQGVRVRVTGSNALRLITTGNIIIQGTLDLAAGDGQSTNCQTSQSGAGGKAGGGGGGGGGAGGACNVQGAQPKAGDGTGPGKGTGGRGGGADAGAGGGGGHTTTGGDGIPSGFGGKGGLPYGANTILNPGSGGGGGACGAAGTSILGVYTPGAGGGGGGGAVLLESRAGSVTISGNILANGGDGGTAPKCGGGLTSKFATGGGGGGGSGGMIQVRAKTEIKVTTTAFLTANGGKGNGTATTKGGNAADGRIRFEDKDGVVSFPVARVKPTPSFGKY